MSIEKVCIVGASGKLGQYMVQHSLDRGYKVVGVCREESVPKLDAYEDQITIVPGATNDRPVIEKAVAGCDGVLTVLVPWSHPCYVSILGKGTIFTSSNETLAGKLTFNFAFVKPRISIPSMTLQPGD